MNKFTSEELDLLYDIVRDKHDLTMNGDWDAVKDEISELHLIMHKILKFQKERIDEYDPTPVHTPGTITAKKYDDYLFGDCEAEDLK